MCGFGQIVGKHFSDNSTHISHAQGKIGTKNDCKHLLCFDEFWHFDGELKSVCTLPTPLVHQQESGMFVLAN